MDLPAVGVLLPAFAAGFIRREALAGVQALGEVLGMPEVGEGLFDGPGVFVVVPCAGGLCEGAVPALARAGGPGRAGLREARGNPRGRAGSSAGRPASSAFRRLSVRRLGCPSPAVRELGERRAVIRTVAVAVAAQNLKVLPTGVTITSPNKHDGEITLVATDAGCQLSVESPDVSFDVGSDGTATLSGTATGKAKNYSITFKATLGTAATTQKFTLTTTE